MLTHFAIASSRCGVRSELVCLVTSAGSTNWVPTTPPTPMVEAKSLCAVALFYVVAEVGDVVAHQGFQGFAFRANLEGAFGVGGY